MLQNPNKMKHYLMIEAGVVFCSAAGTGMSYLNPHSDYLYYQTLYCQLHTAT